MSEAIILTACINPGEIPYTKIIDTQERLKDYIISLSKWIVNAEIKHFIFCDNSNYKYDYDYLIMLAKELGKELEVIKFNGNNMSKKYGKGYGEGKIIEYALNNTKIKNSLEYFYKITGRLYVENFNEIIKSGNSTNLFFKPQVKNRNFVDTRFFKVGVEFYNNNLKGIYKSVDDKKGYYLEHAFYDALILKKEEINSFNLYPHIIGRSGSNGKVYKNKKYILLVKNILSKYNTYSIK